MTTLDTDQRKAIAEEVRRSQRVGDNPVWAFVTEQFKQWPGLGVAVLVLYWGSGVFDSLMTEATASNVRTLQCYQKQLAAGALSPDVFAEVQ